MTKEKNYLGVYLVAFVLIVVGAFYFTASKGTVAPTPSPIVEKEAGTGTGLEHYAHEYFNAGVTAGGRFATTTTDQSNQIAFTGSELRRIFNGGGYADIAIGRIAQTISLPASSSVPDLVPKPGDRQTIIFRSATSTTGADYRIAAGTGFNLNVGSTTPATNASTTPGEWMMATFIRKLDDTSASASTTIGNANSQGDIDVLIQHFK